MKVPAVNVDITDDGTHYIVTAEPWPIISDAVQAWPLDVSPHPYRARLAHTKWTQQKLATFVKKLMSTYPKAAQ